MKKNSKFAVIAIDQSSAAMEKISAIILSLNEEARIGRAIDSLEGIADEIIVVDSESTDRTVEIARERGCRVETRHFSGFGAQRQYATSLARNRYVMFLDADETVSPALQESIKELLSKPLEHRVYSISRLNFFCETPVRHCGWWPDNQVRLFDKRYATWNFHNVGERVIFPDTVTPCQIDGEILHYRCSTPEEYREKLAAHAAIAAPAIASINGRIGPLVPAWRGLKRYLSTLLGQGGILEGVTGRRIAAIQAGAERLTWSLARKILHDNKQK